MKKIRKDNSNMFVYLSCGERQNSIVVSVLDYQLKGTGFQSPLLAVYL
jgi:hypothetical protein